MSDSERKPIISINVYREEKQMKASSRKGWESLDERINALDEQIEEYRQAIKDAEQALKEAEAALDDEMD